MLLSRWIRYAHRQRLFYKYIKKQRSENVQKFAQGKNIFPKIHTRSISHISVLLLHPPISLLCVPVLFFFMGRTSYLSLHLSTELCSSLHKILTGFSGAKDGLDKKDFHAMTNLTFVQNGWYLSSEKKIGLHPS